MATEVVEAGTQIALEAMQGLPVHEPQLDGELLADKVAFPHSPLGVIYSGEAPFDTRSPQTPNRTNSHAAPWTPILSPLKLYEYIQAGAAQKTTAEDLQTTKHQVRKHIEVFGFAPEIEVPPLVLEKRKRESAVNSAREKIGVDYIKDIMGLVRLGWDKVAILNHHGLSEEMLDEALRFGGTTFIDIQNAVEVGQKGKQARDLPTIGLVEWLPNSKSYDELTKGDRVLFQMWLDGASYEQIGLRSGRDPQWASEEVYKILFFLNPPEDVLPQKEVGAGPDQTQRLQTGSELERQLEPFRAIMAEYEGETLRSIARRVELITALRVAIMSLTGVSGVDLDGLWKRYQEEITIADIDTATACIRSRSLYPEKYGLVDIPYEDIEEVRKRIKNF